MKRQLCLFCLLGVSAVVLAAQTSQQPHQEILSYYGQYIVESKRPGLPADSLSSAIQENWLEVKANKPYKIGILLPQTTTPYWRSIYYGITEEAKRLGLSYVILDAGGYDQIDAQHNQLAFEMPKEHVDGVLLASLSYNRMDQAIQEYQQKQKSPVVAVGNDVFAPSVQGKVLSSFQMVGKKICEHIIETEDLAPLNLAFLPGPSGSGWAEDTMMGFNECIQAHLTDNGDEAGQIRVMAEYFGPMVHAIQAKLAEDILTKKENLNYLVTNAVGALEAANLLSNKEALKAKHPNVKIISTYGIPAVYDLVESGGVHAIVSDKPVELGHIAVGMLVRILNGESSSAKKPTLPFRISSTLALIDSQTIKQYPFDAIFGPRRIELLLRYPPPEAKKVDS